MAVLVLTQMMALASNDLGSAGLISYVYPEEVSMAQGLGRQGSPQALGTSIEPGLGL